MTGAATTAPRPIDPGTRPAAPVPTLNPANPVPTTSVYDDTFDNATPGEPPAGRSFDWYHGYWVRWNGGRVPDRAADESADYWKGDAQAFRDALEALARRAGLAPPTAAQQVITYVGAAAGVVLVGAAGTALWQRWRSP